MKRLAFSLLGLFSSFSAFSCSCGPLNMEQAWVNYPHIFVATVERVEQSSSGNLWNQGPNLNQVTLSVNRHYKGAGEHRLVIETHTEASACGFSFIKGVEYAVFAYEHEQKLQVSTCSPSVSTAITGTRADNKRTRVMEFLDKQKAW